METVVKIIMCVVVLLVTGIIALQFKSFKEWLVFAVCEAEQALGSGTGQLKLQYVYDLAITRFPTIAKIITFSVFSKLVDSALIIMKKMIEDNDKIEAVLK